MLALENSIPYKIHVFFPEKLSLEKSKHFGLLVLEKTKSLKNQYFPISITLLIRWVLTVNRQQHHIIDTTKKNQTKKKEEESSSMNK